MVRGKNLKKISLIGLLGGIILTVSACDRESLDMGKAPAEQLQTDNEIIAADISDKAFENLPIIYSLDNLSRAAEPRSGTISGDWDYDGKEDTLIIVTAEQEGSEMIRKLELSLSGCPDIYRIEDADCDFIDILSADFDEDREAEILLLFDMRYAGANGCCGLQLLDKAGLEYVNLVEGFFTGFDYTVKVQTGEDSGYQIINTKSAEEYFIRRENTFESAVAEVTGWYQLEILEGTERNYMRLRQYVAGDDMTDHVGDMVTILSAENNGLEILEESFH